MNAAANDPVVIIAIIGITLGVVGLLISTYRTARWRRDRNKR